MSRIIASARSSATNRFTVRDQSNVIYLDGTSGRVDLDGSFSMENTQAFTIALWMNLNIPNANQEIIGKRLNSGTFRGWSFNIASPGQLQLILRTSATNALHVVTSTRIIVPKQWTHIMATYNGSSLAAGAKIYINGEEKALSVTDDDLNGTIITTGIASIGARNGGTDLFFGGHLADIRLFTEVLTTQQLSNGYLKNDWPTAYAYYPMSDQTGLTLTDFGTSGSNGTLEGSVSWGTDGPHSLRSSASGRSPI